MKKKRRGAYHGDSNKQAALAWAKRFFFLPFSFTYRKDGLIFLIKNKKTSEENRILVI